MRVRALLTIGAVLALLGGALTAVAVTWLEASWGPGPHIFDLEGAYYKQFSAARLGAIAGMATLIVGIGLAAVGLVIRTRNHRGHAKILAGNDPLASLAEELARIAGDRLRMESARADGFGVVDAHVLDLSRDGASPIRIWNEGGGDFWIEIGDDHAAWWRQDARRVALASVLMALLDGEYTIRNGRITVTVDGVPVELRPRG